MSTCPFCPVLLGVAQQGLTAHLASDHPTLAASLPIVGSVLALAVGRRPELMVPVTFAVVFLALLTLAGAFRDIGWSK
jgi:hypothetical protein